MARRMIVVSALLMAISAPTWAMRSNHAGWHGNAPVKRVPVQRQQAKRR